MAYQRIGLALTLSTALLAVAPGAEKAESVLLKAASPQNEAIRPTTSGVSARPFSMRVDGCRVTTT